MAGSVGRAVDLSVGHPDGRLKGALVDALGGAELVVNATSVGMGGVSVMSAVDLPVDPALIGTGSVVVDLIRDNELDAATALLLEEADIDAATLKAAVRRCTIAQTFVPVFMGSAFKNKGVHPLLDGVKDYLPAPTEVENVALDLSKNEEPVVLSGMNGDPVRAQCLAFFFFISLLFSFSD